MPRKKPASLRAVFESTPGVRYLDAQERRHAKALYDAGFTHRNSEYDRLGLTPQDVRAIRHEFIDFIGIDYGDFDWEAWREGLGYGTA